VSPFVIGGDTIDFSVVDWPSVPSMNLISVKEDEIAEEPRSELLCLFISTLTLCVNMGFGNKKRASLTTRPLTLRMDKSANNHLPTVSSNILFPKFLSLFAASQALSS
jgi:hypothetical protein